MEDTGLKSEFRIFCFIHLQYEKKNLAPLGYLAAVNVGRREEKVSISFLQIRAMVILNIQTAGCYY